MVCRLVLLLLLSLNWAAAAEAKIIKVLPHVLDAKGRHTLSPSLYERDAYQAYLHAHEELISALRFDIQYKGPKPAPENLVMRIELRGSKTGLGKVETFEAPVQPAGFFSKWAAIRLSREDYLRIGEIIAWRVTLLSEEFVLAEQESFLW